MHEVDGSDSPSEVEVRLERLESDLAAQRSEMMELRAELDRLRDVRERTVGREPVKFPPPPGPAVVSPPRHVPVEAPERPPAWSPLAQSSTSPGTASGTPRQRSSPENGPQGSARDTGTVSEDPPRVAAAPIFRATSPERKPSGERSVENRIGSQLFNRVGIVAILIGVSLFLKLVYDKHWIHFNPTSRIVTLLLAGAGVVLWSERFRRKGYASFSYSLKAVGTGTLYLALWASFQMYHLLPAWAALALMVGVTCWNSWMAWVQDSELLAAYALVGGFATPALLGSGGNHEVFLFLYVLAMDFAVLLLLTRKPWQRLLLGSFPATVTYFIGWYVKFFTAEQAGVTGVFVVLLAAPFAAVALVGKQREEEWEGVLAPLGAATFLSLSLYSVLQDSGRHAWLPWTAVGLAAVYLLLMRLRRGGPAESIHLAIAVIFLTIAVPLKAEGRWITVGWLAEGVALFWVAARGLRTQVQRRVHEMIRWLACGAMALGIGESLVFWSQQAATRAFWNGRFATELCAVGALALAGWLARDAYKGAGHDPVAAPDWNLLQLVAVVGMHLIAALAVCRELVAFWRNGAPELVGYNGQLCTLSVAAFLVIYGACLVAIVAVRRRKGEQADVVRATTVIAILYLGAGFATDLMATTLGEASAQRGFWNGRLLFQVCALAGLALAGWFARMAARQGEDTSGANWPRIALAAGLGAHIAAVAAGCREIVSQWNVTAPADIASHSAMYRDQLEVISIATFLSVYGSALIAWVARPGRAEEVRGQRTGPLALASLLLLGGTLTVILTPIFGEGAPPRALWNARFLLEMLSLIALGCAAFATWSAHKREEVGPAPWTGIAAWSLLGFNLLAVLAGIREIVTYFGTGPTGEAGLAQAFSISTWLLAYGAMLLAAGFWKRMAFVRWQGLALLVFTIAKVFLYDVRNLSSVYRMVSFIALGAVLMAVSFAYQKDWLKLSDDTADEVTP